MNRLAAGRFNHVRFPCGFGSTLAEATPVFKFPSPDQVYNDAKWYDECNNNPGGDAGKISRSMLVNPLEAEINIERTRIFARKHTRTGLSILEAVRKSKVTIHVVAWRSSNPDNPGFSMFSNDSPVYGEGTVYVNLDQLVEVTAPSEADVRTGRRTLYNNFVLILHEIGHAKQFIDNPSWFRLNQGTGEYIAKQKEALMEVYGARAGKSWGIEAKVLSIMGNPVKSYSSAIEWDNYIYHDGPICDELGLARRMWYTNISGNFGDTFMGGKTNKVYPA
jgi:hypothetical protein